MKKIIIILFLIMAIATPSYALNLLEKIAYREVVVKAYNQRLLVGRVTGEVKYIWQRPTPVEFYGNAVDQGEWVEITDEDTKRMWQDLYDKERGPKKEEPYEPIL